MNKTKVIGIAAGVSFLGAAVYAGWRLWKEVKYQQRLQLEEVENQIEALEKEVSIREEEVEDKDGEVAYLKDQLRIQNMSMSFNDEGEVEYIDNPEMEEMKARFRKKPLVAVDANVDAWRHHEPTPEEEVEDVKEQNESTIVHENAWDVNPSYPIGKKDIPWEQVEKDYEKIAKQEERSDAMTHDQNSERAFELYKGAYYGELYDETQEDIEHFVNRYQFPMTPYTGIDDTVVAALDELFNYPVDAVNMYDENIIDRARAKRESFFGVTSIYANTVSFAEVLLETANLVQDDGYDISRVMVLYCMLTNMDLVNDVDWDDDSYIFNHLIKPVMEHRYYAGEDRFGFFNLSNYRFTPEESTFYQQIDRFVNLLNENDIEGFEEGEDEPFDDSDEDL